MWLKYVLLPPNHAGRWPKLADSAGHRLRTLAAQTMSSSIGSVRFPLFLNFMLIRALLMHLHLPFFGNSQVQMQMDGKRVSQGKKPHFNGTMHAMKTIYGQRGFAGMWRGWVRLLAAWQRLAWCRVVVQWSAARVEAAPRSSGGSTSAKLTISAPCGAGPRYNRASLPLDIAELVCGQAD